MRFSNAALYLALSMGCLGVSEGFGTASFPQSRIKTALLSSWRNNSNYDNNPMDAYQRAMREVNNGFTYSDNDRGFAANGRSLMDGKIGYDYDPNGEFLTRSRSASGIPGTAQFGGTRVQSLVPDQDDSSRRSNSIFIPNQSPMQGQYGGTVERRFNDRTINDSNIYQGQNRAGSIYEPAQRARSNSPNRTRINKFGKRVPVEPKNNFDDYYGSRALPPGTSSSIPTLEPPSTTSRRARYTRSNSNAYRPDPLNDNIRSGSIYSGNNMDRLGQRNQAINDRDIRRPDRSRNFSNNDAADYNGVITEPDLTRGSSSRPNINRNSYGIGTSGISYGSSNGYSSSSVNPLSSPTRKYNRFGKRITDLGNDRSINSVGMRPPKTTGVPRDVQERQSRRYGLNLEGSTRASSGPRNSGPPPGAGYDARGRGPQPLVLEPSNPLNKDGYTPSGTIGGQSVGGRDNRLIGGGGYTRYSGPGARPPMRSEDFRPYERRDRRLNDRRFESSYYNGEIDNSDGALAALLIGAPIAFFVGQEYLDNPPEFAKNWDTPKFDTKSMQKSMDNMKFDFSIPSNFPTAGELRKRIRDVEKKDEGKTQTQAPKPASQPVAPKAASPAPPAPKPATPAPAPVPAPAATAPKPPAPAPAPAPAAPKPPAAPKLTEAEILKQLDAVTIGYGTQQQQQYMDMYNAYNGYVQAPPAADNTQQQYLDAYSGYLNDETQPVSGTSQHFGETSNGHQSFGSSQQISDNSYFSQNDGAYQANNMEQRNWDAYSTYSENVALQQSAESTQQTYQNYYDAYNGYENTQGTDRTQDNHLNSYNSYNLEQQGLDNTAPPQYPGSYSAEDTGQTYYGDNAHEDYSMF